MKFEYGVYTSLRNIQNMIFFSPKPQSHSLKIVIIDDVFERKEQTDCRELLGTYETKWLKMLNFRSQKLKTTLTPSLN